MFESMVKIASMWNRIYLIALATLTVITAGLMYYSYTWLKSITNPVDVAANYESSSHIGWGFLWISAAILLILANVMLWQTRKAWALWATLAYFGFFVILQTFWLDQSFFQYKKNNALAESEFSFSPFLGVGVCIAAAFIVFFDQFLVTKIHGKRALKELPAESDPEEVGEVITDN